MAVNDWYARQFGERDHLAINVSFGPDPHPCGDLARDATWGGISIWARGRCLTSSVSSEGTFGEEVRWSLLEILEWLSTVGVRLVNEEPAPLALRSSRARDTCDWLNDTEEAPGTLNAEQEMAWFESRSDWRRHHALRSAAIDVALPNVVFRRLGDFIEVSWDNETWGVNRPGLRYVERRGTELISAGRAAAVLAEAMRDCVAALANRTDAPELRRFAEDTGGAMASDGDWPVPYGI